MPSGAANPRVDRSGGGPIRRHRPLVGHGTLLAVFVLASLSKLASLTLEQRLCDGPQTAAPRIGVATQAAATTDQPPRGPGGGRNAANATTWDHDPHSMGLPRTRYEILTLKWSLEAHPLRKKNVERMETFFDGLFHVDYAVDVAEDYELVNEIFARNNITCEGMGTGLTLGAIGLWASTIRSWERVLERGDEYDYLVVIQDDVEYDMKLHSKVSKLLESHWRYFDGLSPPMFSMGSGVTVNSYSVRCIPGLMRAMREEFVPGKRKRPLVTFYDGLGIGAENLNFAWAKLVEDAQKDSFIKGMERRFDYDVRCVDKKLQRVEREMLGNETSAG